MIEEDGGRQVALLEGNAAEGQILPTLEKPLAIFDPAKERLVLMHVDSLALGAGLPDHFGKGKSIEERRANALMLVSYAMEWNVPPLVVAQSASIVHGRIMFEGKLIAAMIEKKLGFKLEYEYVGDPNSPDLKIIIRHPDRTRFPHKFVEGTVKNWRTTHNGSPWADVEDWRKMLKYRGDREWCRMWEPGIMAGIVTRDEAEIVELHQRALNARTVGTGLAERLASGKKGEQGFSSASDASHPPADDAAAASASSKGTDAANPSSSRPEKQGGDAPAAAAHPAPTSRPLEAPGGRTSPSIYKMFSDALKGKSSKGDIETAKNAFFKGKERPAAEVAEKLRTIMEMHEKRLALDVTQAQIDAWIEKMESGA